MREVKDDSKVFNSIQEGTEMNRDEEKQKCSRIYTMEYYSATKKNSFESVLMRWMKLSKTFKKSDIDIFTPCVK